MIPVSLRNIAVHIIPFYRLQLFPMPPKCGKSDYRRNTCIPQDCKSFAYPKQAIKPLHSLTVIAL